MRVWRMGNTGMCSLVDENMKMFLYGENIGSSYLKDLVFQRNETHVYSTSKVATTTVKLYSHFTEPQ